MKIIKDLFRQAVYFSELDQLLASLRQHTPTLSQQQEQAKYAKIYILRDQASSTTIGDSTTEDDSPKQR